MANSENVIAKIYGGLGNQMFQYAAGRTLADRLKVPLQLDLSFYRKKRHRSFELQRFPISATILPHVGACGRILQKFRKLSNPPLFKESSFRFDKRFVDLNGPVILDGYFQSPLYFGAIETAVRLELSPPIPQDSGILALGEAMRSAGAISIHVRRGDYVSDKNAAALFAQCTPKYYRSALKMMPRNLPAIVFSDDYRWVKENLDFGRSVRFAADEVNADALGDLWLMTQASHHVIANSTFSWWGAWLKTGNGLTIAPKPWFRNVNTDETDLLPVGWCRVPTSGEVN